MDHCALVSTRIQPFQIVSTHLRIVFQLRGSDVPKVVSKAVLHP